MSSLGLLNRGIQRALLIGAALWLLMSFGAGVPIPPNLSNLEILLVVLSLGLPGAMRSFDPRRRDLKLRRLASKGALWILGLVGLIALLGAMPLALVSSLAALTVMLGLLYGPSLATKLLKTS
jgi:membrane protease YdiL (CAAX protease family)